MSAQIPWRFLKGLAAGALLLASGCAGDADPPPMSAIEVPTAFTAKVAGTWALTVTDTALNAQIEAPGFACGTMTFAVDLDSGLRRYLLQSFRQVADDTVLVDRVLSAGALKSQGYSGQIVIGAVRLTPEVAFQQNGLTAVVDSNVEITATAEVTGPHGRLVHRAFAFTGISHADAGMICQHGARAIARAADSALQQLSVAAAAAFGASPDVRLQAQRSEIAGGP